MAASQLWQLVAPDGREVGPHQRSVTLPRQTAAGPVAGAPVRLAYREIGSGPPAVYLHGSPGSGRDARRLAARLADEFRLIAPDLPGFGSSSRWVPDYGIEAHARYVLAFLDELGLDRVHLICHSMGSGVAFHVARLAPSRVASIVSYAGVGIQEAEGSGDYRFERAKYAAGFGVFVLLPEVLPHFGLLGPRAARHAFVRNFWDTDLRPMRGVLESLETPLLLLHGRQDFLVPAWAARRHHEIVRHSELVMMEGSHFMVFDEAGANRLAEEIRPFLERYSRPDARPARRTLDYHIGPERPDSLRSRLRLPPGLGPWAQVGTLAAATLISEDLTCISAGLLAREGHLDFFVAIVGCVLGIYVGDVGLWLIGRAFGRRVLRWRWVARRISPESVSRFGAGFDRHVGKTVFASRFLPGTRLPVYVGAGMISKRPLAFMVWLFLASWVWTPILVLAAMVFGPVAARPFQAILGVGWLSWAGAAVVLYLGLRVVGLLLTWQGRARLIARTSKLWRWEFWPLWLFYAPVLAWIAWLAVRYRGLATVSAANPAMPHGGFVGESKAETLDALPPAVVQPYVRVDPGDPAERAATLQAHAGEAGWSLPLVLKPDQGQRGVGVKLVGDWDAARTYLATHAREVLAQPYHPGPHEAGIFYYRVPGETTGRIFSITDKRFPQIVGDGQSTLEELVLRDRRLRMQARIFRRRHARQLAVIPAEGERVRLAVAGNHCQGTMFLDGEHLRTPALEAAIDAVARGYDGFYFGRFYVRYESEAALRRGRGFRILELNGITSESTNVYDPSFTLLRAWITLCRQWTLAYRIGFANRERGHRVSTIRGWLRDVRAYYRLQTADRLAD